MLTVLAVGTAAFDRQGQRGDVEAGWAAAARATAAAAGWTRAAAAAAGSVGTGPRVVASASTNWG